MHLHKYITSMHDTHSLYSYCYTFFNILNEKGKIDIQHLTSTDTFTITSAPHFFSNICFAFDVVSFQSAEFSSEFLARWLCLKKKKTLNYLLRSFLYACDHWLLCSGLPCHSAHCKNLLPVTCLAFNNSVGVLLPTSCFSGILELFWPITQSLFYHPILEWISLYKQIYLCLFCRVSDRVKREVNMPWDSTSLQTMPCIGW